MRRLRQQRGVEQQEAAPGIGISRPYLSLLERDEKGRNLDHLRSTFEKAACYYGVLPEYLLAETPQEYIGAFVRRLGEDAPSSSGQRLHLVLAELQLRWGDEFALDRIAETLGTSVDVLADFLADRVQISETVARQLEGATGVAADWLVPRPGVATDQTPELRRIVKMALDSGVEPDDLEMMIQLWLSRRDKKAPPGM